ncbi:hypothetical protein NSS98_24510 [Paenibacillus sp. FSL E2-0274]
MFFITGIDNCKGWWLVAGGWWLMADGGYIIEVVYVGVINVTV